MILSRRLCRCLKEKEHNDFAYTFLWQGDLHVGVFLLDEKSKLHVEVCEEIEVEIYPTVIENGKAVVPVRLRNTTGKPSTHEIGFMFEYEVERNNV